MSSVAMNTPVAESRRRLGQWVGGLAGPVAWFLQLVGVYALENWACTGHGRLILHALSLLCLLAAAVGCWIALARWGETGREWPTSTEESTIGRARLMGALGVMAGLLFSWIICVQWIAIALLDPCPP